MNARNKFIYKSIKKNLKVWIKFKLGIKEHVAGNRFINSDVEEVLKTINKVFKNYLAYGKIEAKSIEGAKVLEIGPGDSFGVALKFLFKGAEEVICFDKFYANRDKKLLKEVYQEIVSGQNKYRFETLFDKELLPINPIKYYYGKGIEKIKLKKNTDFYSKKFDLIISNQVLQEIYNPKPAFKKMIKLLSVGGKMIHHIDFEPYNYFRANSPKEYDFLTYQEFLYKWMVNKRGMTNRKRISEYIEFLDKIDGIKYEFIVYSTFLNKKALKNGPVVYPNFDNEVIAYYKELVKTQQKDIRPKYRKLPIEDFIVGNAYLVIEKTY